ncbi:MAG: hypothetical protein Q9197_003914 [Variospora fuerteventurae]
MVFISICTALYDYAPQNDNELELQEGDVVYILEKSTVDNWWRAKKRAQINEDEEPTGLIPNNYVEETRPSHHARALYDYDRQTDEELSFTEDTLLSVYDTSDQDWTLVGLNGEYGFAPANYIEITGLASDNALPIASSPELLRDFGTEQRSSSNEPAPPQGPAAAIAGIMSRQSGVPMVEHPAAATVEKGFSPRAQFTPEDSDEEPPPPSLPRRPPSQQLSPPPIQYASPRSPDSDLGVTPSPPYNRVISQDHNEDRDHPSPGGFHLYSINETVSALGKKKKLPTTLGLNLATGTIMIAPEKSRDGPQQEWSAEKLTHYSIEGKHVFMELVRPSKSADFHAGAKDTAQEIVAGLGEIAGAARAEGLREVLEIGAGGSEQKKGTILYDFMAQGDDEVTVAVGDNVLVLDDRKSQDWWMVRRMKNGKEGVVPSSYVEFAGTTAPPSTSSAYTTTRSVVEQNRLEEERLAKDALKDSKRKEESEARGSEVGPGVRLPERGSSLTSGNGDRIPAQKSKRISKDTKSSSSSKSKPDSGKIRTWTDRSGSFKVEAQFIGLKDGKIHLHKINGVKIAVPVAKMAIQDLEYVERVTGVSLDDEKPLSDIKRRNTQSSKAGERRKQQGQLSPLPGATIEPEKAPMGPKGPEYDWFDFFLKADVNPYQCERYAFNFKKDSMDENNLPDITSAVLRNLGLKEGDILRVMKYLDNQHGRNSGSSKFNNVSYGEGDAGEVERNGITSLNSGGGLFSGPGGALHNNTRKGRPASAVQSNDVVDAEALKQGVAQDDIAKERSQSAVAAIAPPPPRKDSRGFDDDAVWNVKPSKQQLSTPQQSSRSVSTPPVSAPVRPQQAALTGSMAELSLLSQPLQPIPAQPQIQHASQPPQVQQQLLFQQQPTGLTTPNSSRADQQSAGGNGQPLAHQVPQPPSYGSQPSFIPQQQSQQLNLPRQRPQAPPIQQGSTSLLPPPRPLSAPQTQNDNFPPPPLQPQLARFLSSNQHAQITPPGQSLDDLNQLRLQQQYQQQAQPQFSQQQQQQYPQPTGFGQQQQKVNPLGNGLNSQQIGYYQQSQFQALQPQPTGLQGFQNPQPFLNGQQTGSPFTNPRPATGFQPLQILQTGYPGQLPHTFPAQRTASVNSYLPPALQAQRTGINGLQSHPSGVNHSAPSLPPMPPMPLQNQVPAPLQPQITGPAPAVSFGAPPAKKLLPQPTGKRANLSQATPQNPFGF